MAYLDYRTNQATDPETLDDMERFIGMLSPLHRYTLMLMTADAIATEDYPCAERTNLDLDDGSAALTCPHCLETITEVTHLSLAVTATPADFSSPWYDELVVHHRARVAPLLTWQCPECLNPISLDPEVPVTHTRRYP